MEKEINKPYSINYALWQTKKLNSNAMPHEIYINQNENKSKSRKIHFNNAIGNIETKS